MMGACRTCCGWLSHFGTSRPLPSAPRFGPRRACSHPLCSSTPVASLLHLEVPKPCDLQSSPRSISSSIGTGIGANIPPDAPQTAGSCTAFSGMD